MSRDPSPDTDVTSATDEREELAHARPTAQDVLFEYRAGLGTIVRVGAEFWHHAVGGWLLEEGLVVIDATQDAVELQDDEVLHVLGMDGLVLGVDNLPILPPCEHRHSRLERETH